MLKAESISYKVDGRYLLQPASVAFEAGRFHVVMGANGAGKSTLLKLLAGDLKTASGTIELDGKDLGRYSKQELARRRAVLSQHYHLTFPVAVHELVLMGRYPFFANSPTARDRGICQEAMQVMNVLSLAERDYTTLSGGEAQKVQMSRVLAQIWEAQAGERKVLFLDEPVSHLDVKYQYQLLKATRDLCQHGATVIAILHDINLALSFADRILLMKQGRVVHDLAGAGGVTPEVIGEVFDVKASILTTHDSKPVVVF